MIQLYVLQIRNIST